MEHHHSNKTTQKKSIKDIKRPSLAIICASLHKIEENLEIVFHDRTIVYLLNKKL